MTRDIFCMFCENVPCTCRSSSKKTKAKEPSPPVEIALPAVAPTRSRGLSAANLLKPTVLPHKTVLSQVSSDDDAELARAITVLAGAGLLHRDELIKHRDKIHLPPVKIDAMIWKQDLQERREK